MNARKKEVDTTYLSVTNAIERGFIHRDYIAHCHRWSHVFKRLSSKYKERSVLDVGCGREIPLGMTLFTSKIQASRYWAVDYGPIDAGRRRQIENYFPDCKIHERTDFMNLEFPYQFTDIVCFEVIEHVEPYHGFCMLHKIRDTLTDDGHAYISTPCWDRVNVAANHVNEITYSALWQLLTMAGFGIEGVYGTFASQKDYVRYMPPEELRLFERLSNYYDSNTLSIIFAPLYPQYSRNCLWALTKTQNDESLNLGHQVLSEAPEADRPWGSSEKSEAEYDYIVEEYEKSTRE